MKRPAIVHVSGDFPSPFGESKTPVVRSLVELVADRFDQRAIALDRVWPGRFEEQTFGSGTALRYPAPPFGILHWTMLERLGERITGIVGRGAKPDLVVGHKLTIEGQVVAKASRLLDVPYAVTIQGNTDCKILAARPDLRRRLAQVYHEATVVFALAPWTIAAVERRLGKRDGSVVLLPAPTDLDAPLHPAPGDGTLVTAFHLEGWRTKNLAGMAAALRGLKNAAPRLEVIGGGSDAITTRVRRAAAGAPTIAFAGPMGRAALRERLHRATGLVLPSLRESFGLVFVEALFAGLPIVYPTGAAVDGWFDGLPFAIRVDPRDPAAIGDAMLRLIREEAALKVALADWLSSDSARRFTRPAIGNAFAQGLRAALAQ